MAKKSVYLKTLKLLYDLKEIDNNLMIKKFDIRNENFRHLFPHYKIDEDNNKSEQEQRKKKKHIYETSVS